MAMNAATAGRAAQDAENSLAEGKRCSATAETSLLSAVFVS